MSLCLYKQITDNLIIIGSDSRACTYDENETPFVSNDATTKIHAIDNNTLIFGSGIACVLLSALDEFKISQDKSMDCLARLAKKYTDVYIESGFPLGPRKDKDSLLTLFIVIQVVDKRIKKWVIANSMDYEPFLLPNNPGEIGVAGCASEYCENNFSKLVKDVTDIYKLVPIFRQMYNSENSYEVGGMLTVYLFSDEGILKRYDYPIVDKEEYRRVIDNSHFELKGLNIVNDTGVHTLTIDSSGDITMKDSTLEAASIISGTISGTTITGNRITGNTITGETIIGGTISGTTISSSTIEWTGSGEEADGFLGRAQGDKGQSQVLCILQIAQNRAKIFSRAVRRKAAYRLGNMIAGSGGRVKGGRGSDRSSRPLTCPAGSATRQSCPRNRPQAGSG